MTDDRNKKWSKIVMNSRLLKKVSSLAREVVADQILLFVGSLVVSSVPACLHWRILRPA